MSWKRWLAVLPGVLLALGLAACVGDEDDNFPEAPDTGVTVTSVQTSAQTSEGAAGGTAASPAPPGAEIDACGLLLLEDVEPLIGAAPEPTSEPVGPFAVCSYWDTASSFVQFQVCRCLFDDEMELSLQMGASTLGVELKQIAGVGDRAFWMEGILWVQQGDVTINLWISRPAYFAPDGTAMGGAELEVLALPDAEAMAQTVLARIE